MSVWLFYLVLAKIALAGCVILVRVLTSEKPDPAVFMWLLGMTDVGVGLIAIITDGTAVAVPVLWYAVPLLISGILILVYFSWSTSTS